MINFPRGILNARRRTRLSVGSGQQLFSARLQISIVMLVIRCQCRWERHCGTEQIAQTCISFFQKAFMKCLSGLSTRSIRLFAVVQVQQESCGIIRQILVTDTQDRVPQFIDAVEIENFVLEERLQCTKGEGLTGLTFDTVEVLELYE